MKSGAVDVPPMRTRLAQNFPNPFRRRTTIWYDLTERTPVTLTVYDRLGRRVTTLVDAVQSAGRYTATFRGAGLASGVYFYRLETGAFSRTRQLVIVR
jgi:hypothetical protein